MAKVSAQFKAIVQQKAHELIETILKPRYVLTPSEEPKFNYIVDIYTKWYRHYFYFCAKYQVVGPHAIRPDFERKFARLEYIGGNRFNLSYERHNGQWLEIYADLTLDECLSAVRDDPWFQGL